MGKRAYKKKKKHFVEINNYDDDEADNDKNSTRRKPKYRYSIAHLQQYQNPLIPRAHSSEDSQSHSLPISVNDLVMEHDESSERMQTNPMFVPKKKSGGVSKLQKIWMRSNSLVRDRVVIEHGQKHQRLEDMKRSKSEELTKSKETEIGQMIKTYTEMSILNRMKKDKEVKDADSEWSYSSISSASSGIT